MRNILPAELESGRIISGRYGSNTSYGPFGAFIIQGPCGRKLRIISSGAWDVFYWEHVSVSIETRCPNWDEMCFVKNLFWSEDEVVMQIHPAKKDYINHHPFCLHLWRPTSEIIPLPPKILVGEDHKEG